MKTFTSAPIGLCIHHSLTKDGKTVDGSAIRKYHIETNGWDDIGYHYLVERVAGKVQIIEGRPVKFQGAHCPALNATHLGVCLVGNYDLAPPDAELLGVLESLCASLMRQYAIPLRGIVYHCDYSQKTCPGRQFPKTGLLLALAKEERP
jgi:hypothetical protein